MCELFGMSARHPTRAQMSLALFGDHGGQSGPHKDGWGAAFYQGKDAWLFRSTEAAASSAGLDYVQNHAPATRLMISHIRLATHGKLALENTQPFTSALFGQRISFAHNGHVPGVMQQALPRHFQPIGDTDSERVFSVLLAWLEELSPLPEQTRYAQLEQRLQHIAEQGPLNLLFSNGQQLFAFSNKRTQKDGEIRAPGMVWLSRQCSAQQEQRNSGISIDSDQKLILFASVPLTDEDWQPMPPNRLWIAQDGDWVFQNTESSVQV